MAKKKQNDNLIADEQDIIQQDMIQQKNETNATKLTAQEWGILFKHDIYTSAMIKAKKTGAMSKEEYEGILAEVNTPIKIE
jgi:hypothetical protein